VSTHHPTDFYFKEGWNCFDFFVVAMCFMPFGGSAVAVLRLLRLLRVLKLFNNIKELQIILSGLAKGMSSVSYIGLLMFLLFYVFGIVALMFFRCVPFQSRPIVSRARKRSTAPAYASLASSLTP